MGFGSKPRHLIPMMTLLIPMMTLLVPNQGFVNLPLSTMRGNPIPNQQRGQMHPDRMACAQLIHVTQHPGIRPRSLSSRYNCVGMVFSTRRTWIEPELVERILEEDGYRQVLAEQDLKIGDLVVYRDSDSLISHIGVIVSLTPHVARGDWEITVLSQWGADGEYVHDIEDVHTLLGRPTEFWTDRK